MDSNLRSSGCKPAALAAELLGNGGAGGRFRAAIGALFQGAALPFGATPAHLFVGPDPANRTRSWRFCRPPPSHLARSGSFAIGTRRRIRTLIAWVRATGPTR